MSKRKLAELGFLDLLDEQPELLHIASDTWHELHTGSYPEKFVKAIMQDIRDPQFPSVTDAYIFAIIWADMVRGKIASFDVGVGSTPERDQMADSNQCALDQGLQKPLFSATIRNGTAPDDGEFKWTQPIEATVDFIRHHDPAQNMAPDLQNIPFPPSSVSLEIGNTNPETTLLHIREGGVARWPYGMKDITVFLPVR